MKNIVDERFELTALIFRLAGIRLEYCEVDTDYQREVVKTFARFSEHPVVNLAKTFDGSNGVWVGFDAVVKFAVHIEKKDNKFIYIDDISSMYDNGRWNEAAAKEFLPLFNDFYVITNYSDFFISHIPYFEEITHKFVDEIYSAVNFTWFGKYIDPSNLQCIFSPSITTHNYSSTVNDKIIYCVVTAKASASTVVHEFCHSFGNPLAHEWYKENEIFKKWCDDSVNTALNPSYTNGWTMSGEYVTRGYNILYCCQQNSSNVAYVDKNGLTYTWGELIPLQMKNDYKRGFLYIGEVYAMIFEMEKNK